MSALNSNSNPFSRREYYEDNMHEPYKLKFICE